MPLLAAFFVALLSCVPAVAAGDPEGPDRAPLAALGIAVLAFIALTVYQRLARPGSFDDGDTLQEALDRVDAEVALGLRDPPGQGRNGRSHEH